jgi:serine/threonine protein kinase
VWLAPEVMENKIYTEKADVYSIGVILWELISRKAFFGEVSFMSQIEDKVRSRDAVTPAGLHLTARACAGKSRGATDDSR